MSSPIKPTEYTGFSEYAGSSLSKAPSNDDKQIQHNANTVQKLVVEKSGKINLIEKKVLNPIVLAKIVRETQDAKKLEAYKKKTLDQIEILENNIKNKLNFRTNERINLPPGFLLEKFLELSNQIDKKMSSPSILATKIKKNNDLNFFSMTLNKLSKIWASIREFTQQNKEYKKFNNLVGKYQQIPLKDYESIIEHLKSEDFNKCKASFIENNTGLEIFNEILDQFTIIRQENMRCLRNGENALALTDELTHDSKKIIVEDAIAMLLNLISIADLVADAKKTSHQNLDPKFIKIKNSLNALLDSTFLYNNQIVTDNIFPNEILEHVQKYPNKFDKDFSNYIKNGAVNRTSNQIGNDGFQKSKKDSTLDHTFKTKVTWENISKNQCDAFQKGVLSLTLLLDNHEIKSNVKIDLSSLGDLNQDQTALIFYGISRYISKQITPKNENKESLLDNEQLNEALQNITSTMNLTEDQRKTLYDIVYEFNRNVINASSLAFLSIGHKQPKPNFSDEEKEWAYQEIL